MDKTEPNLTNSEKEELKKNLLEFVSSVTTKQIKHQSISKVELDAMVSVVQILVSSF
ncbi:hypothetical protein [uncultured Olegusella sp.]|uniref:hypothetical protein n=1 Tax=uncultured Olegusella sp. TaxID=1979846 RepID=UPI002604F95B|nr:hypothetical protein [uncultured Olegusella sp.]